MALAQFFINTLNNLSKVSTISVRNASKKASSSTAYGGKSKPKNRGLRVKPGQLVSAGTMLAVQRRIQFHPGLHVGFGRNATLFAIEPGKVMITCEVADLNWDHFWVQKHYNGRFGQKIYKKYINVIPDPQHQRFKLIDMI